MALALSVDENLDDKYGLSIYPNPSRIGTSVSFKLSTDEKVRITLIDISGKVVKNLLNSRLNKGEYNIFVDTSDLERGLYLCIFKTGASSQSVKLIVK